MAFTPVQLQTSDRRLLQAWVLLNQRIGKISSTGFDAGLANVLYVSKDGNDATATPNSLVNKYEHVQAALTAAVALPNAVVYIGPGVYTESLVLTDFVNLGIVADDPVGTAIVAAAADTPALSIVPTADVQSLYIEGVLFAGSVADGAAPGVVAVDGSAVAGGLFQNGQFRVRNVEVLNSSDGRAFSLTNADGINFGDVRFDSTVSSATTFTSEFLECVGVLRGCELGHSLTRFDPANPRPASNKNRLLMYECEVYGLTVQNRPEVELFGGRFEGSIAPAVSALVLQVDDDATYVGRVLADGVKFAWNALLDANYGTVAPPPTANQSVFNNCSFSQVVSASGTGAVRHGPRLRSCTFAFTILANNGADIDIRGSQYEQANLGVAGTGAIDRDTVRLLNLQFAGALAPTIPAAAIPVLGNAPFPTYVAGPNAYSVLVEPVTLGAPAGTWNIDPASKTDIGFNAESFIGGIPNGLAVDVLLVRQ